MFDATARSAETPPPALAKAGKLALPAGVAGPGQRVDSYSELLSQLDKNRSMQMKEPDWRFRTVISDSRNVVTGDSENFTVALPSTLQLPSYTTCCVLVVTLSYSFYTMDTGLNTRLYLPETLEWIARHHLVHAGYSIGRGVHRESVGMRDFWSIARSYQSKIAFCF